MKKLYIGPDWDGEFSHHNEKQILPVDEATKFLRHFIAWNVNVGGKRR